ncbi:MAG TPA: penicillin acylase family protein [Methylomirabilota bacterium]|nr:penicillin acylase family protein [Methylomirabilota bacterium]
MRTALRFLVWVAAIVVVALGMAVWWFVYRPLPPLDGSLSLPGLKSEVTVERDNWGIPHIRATSVEDLAEAQGFVTAEDRLWQMDLLRRAARGQLSEVLGPATLKIDKDFRVLNFSRAAEVDLQMTSPEVRRVMEAYARGVNHFIEMRSNRLPIEFTLLNYKPTPWQASDSLVLACYMYRTLTDTRQEEMRRAVVTAKVGPELAKDLFRADASMDHFVVGDPGYGKDRRAQTANPDEDDDSADPEDVLKANVRPEPSPAGADAPDVTSALAGEVAEWLSESQRQIRQSLGSNNWVVAGEHTATGKPLLANDMHLELTLAPIWYEVHLTAPEWNVKGFSLPGAPMVVVGHNDRIAWGFTNNGADVLDLYIETFNAANPDEYLVNGEWKKADVYDEVIKVKGQPDEHLRLVVTRHGPVVKEEGDKGYAMRWTVLEPGALCTFYNWLGKAQNWAEFRETMKGIWGPGQNVVYADVDGNIGYILGAHVPVRKKGHGEVPVPGDTDDYEWTGYIPFEELPQAFNPESGLIITANARVVGPNYKPYITDHWEEPYRTARIYDLLHDKQDLRPEDMLRVQADTYSYPHVFIAEQLVAATNGAPPKDERARKLIQQAKDWNGIADANSPVVSFLDATMYRALHLILQPQLGDDTDLYQWRKVAFLQRILTERPARWLPSDYKSYDELLAAAADQAVLRLQERTKDKDPDDWPWKKFNYLDMLHPIGREGLLKKLLSITDQPQSGTEYSPRAASRHHGPSERFVANLADWDRSIMVITGGESGQPGSEHYRDQFPYWFEGRAIYAPFSDAAEAKANKHSLTLKPGS